MVIEGFWNQLKLNVKAKDGLLNLPRYMIVTVECLIVVVYGYEYTNTNILTVCDRVKLRSGCRDKRSCQLKNRTRRRAIRLL
jgi:hypothetical protein